MKAITVFALTVFGVSTLLGQTYNDYLGAGHSLNIKVTSSSEEGNALAAKTIDGFGLLPTENEASRFLHQATFGPNYEAIQELKEIGYQAWFEKQMNAQTLSYEEHVGTRAADLRAQVQMNIENCIDEGVMTEDQCEEEFFVDVPATWLWHAFYAHSMDFEDMLRQRMTFALSEILVVSLLSDLGEAPVSVASYYDVLNRHALGNYRDLLGEVTLHSSMGYYLSHLQNAKFDPETGRFPDENYAREVMQLFTIGIYELNQDGTRKKDETGAWIPTYNNDDITELAKVFTGLSYDPMLYVDAFDDFETLQDLYDYIEYVNMEGENVELFYLDFLEGVWERPMTMYEEYHETGPKNLLNGYTIPPGQPGMQDIDDALDHLFTHPNTSPFISKLLIQRLVTSNPSPEYVKRVAAVFDNNGAGQRGDLMAVAKAILLDPEARNCIFMNDSQFGKLREPFIRHLVLCRAFDVYTESGLHYNSAFTLLEFIRQLPMAAPTVFNFYLPTYQPLGPVLDAGLVAPEFQIVNSTTVINYYNLVHYWLFEDYLYEAYDVLQDDWVEANAGHLDLSDELALGNLNDLEELIDRLDLILCYGSMSENTKSTILNAVNQINTFTIGAASQDELREYRVKTAIYLVMISPDFVVLQ